MFKNVKEQFEKELQEIRDGGMWKEEGVIEGKQGPEIKIGGKTLLNFCANNYLGLAASDELAEAAKEGVDKYGFGEASVRFIVGTSTIHKDLEKEIAQFFGQEDSITYTSCFDANTGLFETILKEGDAVFSDELNHASIIDGIRLCKAERFRYKNSDMGDLENQLRAAGERRRKLIATDGVFSMEGDIAPLPEIVEIADKYGAITMVDDAHGEGVLGRGGRGIVDHFNLHGKVDIEVGTMSKAFGVVGGYIAGSKQLTDYLAQKGRPFLFSSAVTAADVAACSAAVDALIASDILVKQLWQNTEFFQEKIKHAGFNIGNTKTPITPIILGDTKVARDFSRMLFEAGIFAQAIGYPTVPIGKARIRVMLSAIHSKKDLAWAIERFEKIGKALKVI